jgi:hypothetical protein
VATVVAAFVTIAAVALAARAVRRMVRVIRLGQPVPADRFEAKARRTVTMLRETLGHTRMLKWSGVGLAHWFVMMSFLVLFLLVVEAYVDVANPSGTLALLGGWAPYGLVTEALSVFGLAGILALIGIRLRDRPGRARGLSRFTGSTMWQAYYVEWTIVGVLVCGLLIRGLKFAGGHGEYPAWATPVTHALGQVLPASDAAVSLVAMVKLVISMAWLITIALNPTMGEERIGKRINVERVEEALSTGATTVAVSCPFCLTMLGDGVTGKQASDEVEVVDVATVLLRSLDR